MHRAFATYRRLSAFSFGTAGTKEKANKKKTPFGGVSLVATSEEGVAPPPHKPLKRLERNFYKGVCGHCA